MTTSKPPAQVLPPDYLATTEAYGTDPETVFGPPTRIAYGGRKVWVFQAGGVA